MNTHQCQRFLNLAQRISGELGDPRAVFLLSAQDVIGIASCRWWMSQILRFGSSMLIKTEMKILVFGFGLRQAVISQYQLSAFSPAGVSVDVDQRVVISAVISPNHIEQLLAAAYSS